MIVDEEAEVNRANGDSLALGLPWSSSCQELSERIFANAEREKGKAIDFVTCKSDRHDKSLDY